MAGFWVSLAMYVGAAAVAGTSVYEGSKNRTAIKKASDAATEANNKALADAEAAQAAASDQAQAQILEKRRKIASSNTIFTDPMGLSSQAMSAKKTILGG